MSSTSNDASDSQLPTTKAHAKTPKPLRTECRKDSLVTKSSSSLSNRSRTTSKPTQTPSASSKRSLSSSHSRELKSKSTTTDSDFGPQRGNRAATTPRHVSAPDVDAFIKHIATHGRRHSTSHGTQPSLTSDTAHKPTFTPQYAARGHGNMMPGAFKKAASKEEAGVGQKGKITAAVWQELGRQHRKDQARGEAGAEAKKGQGESGVRSDVLQRALKEREGGYRHGVGS